MEKEEFRILIKHCYLMGKNTVQAKQWLDKCYPQTAPAKSTVIAWFAEFKRGRTSTDDAPRAGRPKFATTPENVKKIEEIIREDSRVGMRKIADIVKISLERVGHILQEDLAMRKLCSRWVPRSLTEDQKGERLEAATSCLYLYRRDKEDFLSRYVTIDETWMHHIVPEPIADDRPRKRARGEPTAEKLMISVFWDSLGIILIDYTRNANGQYYVELMRRLREEIDHKRPHLQGEAFVFHHGNGPGHELAFSGASQEELQFTVLPHPAYSPDLAPSDYHLFPDRKRSLQGKKFGSIEDVLAETEAYFANKDEAFFREGIAMLESRWSECIAREGNYLDA